MKRNLKAVWSTENSIAYMNFHEMPVHRVDDFPEIPFRVGELLVWEYEERTSQGRTRFSKLATVTKTFPDNLTIQALLDEKVVAFHNLQSTVHSTLSRLEKVEEIQ